MRTGTSGPGEVSRGGVLWLAVLGILALAAPGSPALASPLQETGHGESAESHDTEGHGAGHHHKNHIGIFVGPTEAEEHHGETGDPDFTLGLDYERRINRTIGLGGMLDWVVEGRREYLVGPIGFLHLGKGAKLLAAPCYQHVREGDQDNFVFRVGAAWDFSVGRRKKYALSPTVMYDFAEEQDFLVLGLTLGIGY